MARTLNGTSSDYVEIAAQQWPQSAYSACAWINPSSLDVDVIWAQYDNSAGVDAAYGQFFFVSDGTVTARIHQTKDTVYIGRSTNSGAISAGTFANFGYSWSGGTTNAAIKIYKNGTQVDTTDGGAGSFTAAYSGSTVPLYIGGQKGLPGTLEANMVGVIAEFAVWDLELTAAEFAALAKGCSPLQVRPSGLIHYLPLLRANTNYMGVAPTVNGTTVSAHPRVIMPNANSMIGHNSGAVAPAGGVVGGKLIGGILTRPKLISGRLAA
jgi:hypothetical protein